MQKFVTYTESDKDSFINKLKGALMYAGGDFENKDLNSITAYALIDTCFKNHIKLDCKLGLVSDEFRIADFYE